MHRCAQQSCRARAAPRPRRVPGPKHSAAEELLSPVRHVAHVRRRSCNGIAAVKRVVRPPAQAAACRTRRLARPATGLRPRRRARRTKRVPGGAPSQAEDKIVKYYMGARHPPLRLAHLRYRAREPMRGEGAAPPPFSVPYVSYGLGWLQKPTSSRSVGSLTPQRTELPISIVEQIIEDPIVNLVPGLQCAR